MLNTTFRHQENRSVISIVMCQDWLFDAFFPLLRFFSYDVNGSTSRQSKYSQELVLSMILREGNNLFLKEKG